MAILAVKLVSMVDYKLLLEKVNLSLTSYWDERLSSCVDREEREIVEHLKEHNLRGGKRMRAVLVWLGYMLNKREFRAEVMKVMMGVELIHTALLIQDDVMDNDEIRRGKPATQVYFAEKRRGNKHFGESMAIIASDVALTMGYGLILNCGLEDVLVREVLNGVFWGIERTGYGQAMDISGSFDSEGVDEESVLRTYRLKTAVYSVENPLRIGAVFSGITGEQLNLLSDFALNLGVAFQISDDLLGFFGDSEKTGKSVDSDILQGKKTLLMVKVLELTSEEERQRVKEVWGNREAKSLEIEEVREIARNCGACDYCKKMIEEKTNESILALDKLRREKLNMEVIDYLETMVKMMVKRES